MKRTEAEFAGCRLRSRALWSTPVTENQPKVKPTALQTARRIVMGVYRHVFNVLSLDLRSLALLRVSLGTLMLVDIWGRLPDVEAFYTDFGVLPRVTHIEHFMDKWTHSIHLLGGQPGHIYALLGLQAVFAVLFLVGY
ncbi:MAG: hypothetical protein ACI9OJ_002515, partial [Myxococcota bacterium]